MCVESNAANCAQFTHKKVPMSSTGVSRNDNKNKKKKQNNDDVVDDDDDNNNNLHQSSLSRESLEKLAKQYTLDCSRFLFSFSLRFL